jgi:ubiquinone/menaquinone biosynthesis C-methylase UbiE
VSRVTPISSESLRRLHPRSLTDPERILGLLERVQREGAVLWRATNRFSERETARVRAVDADGLVLETENFERGERSQIFLNFELEGRPYFFAAPVHEWLEPALVSAKLPAVLYQAERRDRLRRAPAPDGGEAVRVELWNGTHDLGTAEVVDVSADGLGLRLPETSRLDPGTHLQVTHLDGERPGYTAFAEVRSTAKAPERPGWIRLGVTVSERSWDAPLAVERRHEILEPLPRLSQLAPTPRVARTRHGASAEVSVPTPTPRVVHYQNRQQEPLYGIVDAWGDTRGAPAVVIPSAWGRTKETLLPLAATIVATFRAVGQPVVVVRFDGTHRRGESYRDPECREPGAENLHFTFSQGARDVHATLDFLERTPEFRPPTSILVTFSVASIEGRRSMACDPGHRLGGWVSVVGSADAQSLTRVISGGVDYFGGAERGVRFGVQEIQGLLVDMDRAGADALAERLAFLEDARRDFASIRSPITWLHGRHDAWMDLARIQHVLAFGDSRNRRLIELPTGHQLRTSRQALEVFQLIATEVARMALSRELPPTLPDLKALEVRREAETQRLSEQSFDLRSFWHDYLVGREGGLGMELVTHTRSYRDLMDAQIRALDLDEADAVLDVGSGLGSFPLQLRARRDRPTDLRVTEVDYVLDALSRARRQLERGDAANGVAVRYVGLDLDLNGSSACVPLQDASHDAAVASLLLNYVGDPDRLLRELHRILRSGGRLVVSSLKRDADISTICVDTISELRSGLGREALGADGERRMDRSLRDFINDAARLLDLEERGVFHFWEEAELTAMLERAGFRNVRIDEAFGTPAQALLATADRS